MPLPFDRISLEMIYRGLYHFSVAYDKGNADDPIKYFAALDDAKQVIRINAVNPGPIATDLMARSADQMGMTLDDIGSVVPMRHIKSGSI